MNKVKSVLTSIVKACENKHGGGEAFFTELDERIRTPFFFRALVATLPTQSVVVVSGKFGVLFERYLLKSGLSIQCIRVNGSLRKGQPLIIHSNKKLLSTKDIIFVDDSFYSGKTFRKIENAVLLKHGSIASGTVIYDGSKVKDSRISSFYRYY